MEEALEKLKVLGGEKFLKPQYTRVYFAIDISGGRNYIVQAIVTISFGNL